MTRSFKGQEPEPGGKEGWQSKLDKIQSFSRYSEDEIAVEPQKTDSGKRLVAFIIDAGVGYCLGLVLGPIPLIKDILHPSITMILYLVIRDAFWNGRGVGKNLMGLQVVDLKTGAPADLLTSIKRNIVIFGPALLINLTLSVLKLIPTTLIDQYIPGATSFLNQSVLGIISLVGSGYTLIVIPYEIYRTFTREDGMRWGDQFAGTTIIEAPMDFSWENLLPRGR
jgi:uncharacterized RDD family membrane protein YckC